MKRLTVWDIKLVKEQSKHYDVTDIVINSSYKAGEFVQMVLDLNSSAVEKFGLLCVNAQNEVIGIHIVNIGSLAESLVNIKGVMQRALLNNAYGIILFHNHPSGKTEPSAADVDVTNKIRSACDLMEFKLFDHIIVGDGQRTYSFAEHGLI